MIFDIAKRVINEVFADKRTIALLLFAPLLIITLISIIFTSDYRNLNVGYVGDLPTTFSSETITYQPYEKLDNALSELEQGKIDAILLIKPTTKNIDLNSILNTQQIQFLKQNSIQSTVVSTPTFTYEIYLAGMDPILEPYIQTEIINSMNIEQQMITTTQLQSNFELNDYLIVFIMQFVILFFSFLTVGISFLRERNSATLQRMLTFNISRSTIVFGYLLGFGFISILQSIVIEFFSIYVLNLNIQGSIIFSIFCNFIYSFVGISLGCFISSFARNEFQIMQFIPLIIIPQLIFSNILPYGETYQRISKLLPITYGLEIQKKILLFDQYDIFFELSILIFYILLFFILTTLSLKKIRKI